MGCHGPFPLPRLLPRQPCRQHPALARSLLLRHFPGQSGSSPAPTGSTLLGEIRDRTTLAGELLHSPKAGKSHASTWLMSLMAAAFPGKGECNPH